MGRSSNNTVDAERVVHLVQEQVDKHRALYFNGRNTVELGGMSVVAELSGISSRSISDIVHGRKLYWNVSTLDKFLTKMDLEHLSYLPPEEGGFADVYDSMTASTPRGPYVRRDRSVKCPSCGGTKTQRAEVCQKCFKERKAKRRVSCVDCGKHLEGGYRKRSGSPRCKSCWETFRKTDEETQNRIKKWKKNSISLPVKAKLDAQRRDV